MDSTIQPCSDACRCISYCTMYHSVPDCIRLYQTVPDCIRLYQTVSDCTRLYHSVSYCTMYHSVPDCIRLYQHPAKSFMQRTRYRAGLNFYSIGKFSITAVSPASLQEFDMQRTQYRAVLNFFPLENFLLQLYLQHPAKSVTCNPPSIEQVSIFFHWKIFNWPLHSLMNGGEQRTPCHLVPCYLPH